MQIFPENLLDIIIETERKKSVCETFDVTHNWCDFSQPINLHGLRIFVFTFNSMEKNKTPCYPI